MCFRPVSVRKREVVCPKCQEKNPVPLSIDSQIAEILANEKGKAILEQHCPFMTGDPRLKNALGMTLKQVRPMSQGKLTQDIHDLVAKELDQLPKPGCKKCGESLPAA